MHGTAWRRVARVALVSGIFAAGFLCGSVSERHAVAQVGLPGGAMEKATGAIGGQGGALGAATKLGTSIADMQEHLDALQKNMDTLRQVKGMLGG